MAPPLTGRVVWGSSTAARKLDAFRHLYRTQREAESKMREYTQAIGFDLAPIGAIVEIGGDTPGLPGPRAKVRSKAKMTSSLRSKGYRVRWDDLSPAYREGVVRTTHELREATQLAGISVKQWHDRGGYMGTDPMRWRLIIAGLQTRGFGVFLDRVSP